MYEKWLQAFHMVAKEGGFTAAARVLNVGQPTVSTHVRSLENYFGVELFHRRGRNVVLTGVGRSLLIITDGLFGHEEEAVIRGLGIGVVSESEFASHERLKTLRVSDAEMHIYAYVACLAERRNRPLIAAFFETVDTLVGRHGVKPRRAIARAH